MPTVPQDKTSSASAFELSRLMAANAERSATRRATPVPSWCATCFSLTSSYVCEAGAPPSPAHTRTHTTLRCCLRRSALTNEAAGRQQPSCNGATFFAYHVGRASLVRSLPGGARGRNAVRRDRGGGVSAACLGRRGETAAERCNTLSPLSHAGSADGAAQNGRRRLRRLLCPQCNGAAPCEESRSRPSPARSSLEYSRGGGRESRVHCGGPLTSCGLGGCDEDGGGGGALRRTGTRAESSRSSRCIQTLACALPREFTGMFIARCLVTIPGGGTPPPPLLPPQRTRRLHLSAKAAPSVASKGQASPGAGEEQGRGGARGSARRERAPRGSAAVSPHGLVLERWCHLRARAVAVAAVFVGCEARESELMQSGDIIDQR